MATQEQPKSLKTHTGVSHGKVLYDCGDSFNRFMADHAKILTKKMSSKKILKKTERQFIKDQKYDSSILLTFVKRLPLEKFIDYLELLIEIQQSPEEDVHLKLDTVKLIGIMKGSLESMKSEPGSRLHAAVSKFIHITHSAKEQQGIDAKTSTISEAPNRPPLNQLGHAIGASFTNTGGVLYSSVHGVCVTIPPNIIPGAIGEFYLSMHFYLAHPFIFADGIKSCSVIVWLTSI